MKKKEIKFNNKEIKKIKSWLEKLEDNEIKKIRFFLNITLENYLRADFVVKKNPIIFSNFETRIKKQIEKIGVFDVYDDLGSAKAIYIDEYVKNGLFVNEIEQIIRDFSLYTPIKYLVIFKKDKFSAIYNTNNYEITNDFLYIAKIYYEFLYLLKTLLPKNRENRKEIYYFEKYDYDKKIMVLSGKKVLLAPKTKDTDGIKLLEILLSDIGEIFDAHDVKKLFQIGDGENNKNRKFYDAKIKINKIIKKQTGIKDFITGSTKEFYINSKYIKSDR